MIEQKCISHSHVNNGGSNNKILTLAVLNAAKVLVTIVTAQEQILGILASTDYKDRCSLLIMAD